MSALMSKEVRSQLRASCLVASVAQLLACSWLFFWGVFQLRLGTGPPQAVTATERWGTSCVQRGHESPSA